MNKKFVYQVGNNKKVIVTELSQYFIMKDCNVDVCCCEHPRFQMETQYLAKNEKGNPDLCYDRENSFS
jgi:hypothetical protein